jgi:hypothetical protein
LFHQTVAHVADVVNDVYSRTINYHSEVDSNERFSKDTGYKVSLPDIYKTGTTGWGCQMSECKYCRSNFLFDQFYVFCVQVGAGPWADGTFDKKFHEKDHLETLPQNKAKKVKKAKKAMKTKKTLM